MILKYVSVILGRFFHRVYIYIFQQCIHVYFSYKYICLVFFYIYINYIPCFLFILKRFPILKKPENTNYGCMYYYAIL